MSYSQYHCSKSPFKKEEGEDEKKTKEGVTAYTMSEDTAIKAWSKMSDTEKKIYTKRNPDFTVPKLN